MEHTLQYAVGGFVLAALVAALVFYGYRSRLRTKVEAIKSLPEEDRAASLTALADTFRIDTINLSGSEKLIVIQQQVAIRARRDFLVVFVLIFFGILGARLAGNYLNATTSKGHNGTSPPGSSGDPQSSELPILVPEIEDPTPDKIYLNSRGEQYLFRGVTVCRSDKGLECNEMFGGEYDLQKSCAGEAAAFKSWKDNGCVESDDIVLKQGDGKYEESSCYPELRNWSCWKQE